MAANNLQQNEHPNVQAVADDLDDDGEFDFNTEGRRSLGG